MKKKVNFTKDEFVGIIKALKEQTMHDRKCSDAFSLILPNDYISSYQNKWVVEKLIEVVVNGMYDNINGWIEYYIYEMNYGESYEKGDITMEGKNVKLKTITDLWNILTQKYGTN